MIVTIPGFLQKQYQLSRTQSNYPRENKYNKEKIKIEQTPGLIKTGGIQI